MVSSVRNLISIYLFLCFSRFNKFTILLEFIYTEYISPEKTVKHLTLSEECFTLFSCV